ncbi:PilZ domain-containing protein [Colwellia sp. MEBiC06753]
MTDSSNHEIERRQSFRLDMEKELIEIVWTDANGQVRHKTTACLDFSRGGLRIDSDIEFIEDASVKVIFKPNTPKKTQLAGKVLRCIKQDTGWFEVAFILDEQA